ncbi:MAG: aromatic ring-hydroxylating dioxygenase subunit alpha [Bacteroidetes bacterium]|nr:aromatic ring-hydroxylating dioxygenase subunit alpha [Bacteroidota bacterium]
MQTPYRFEPDLANASTIPAAWYTDPAMLIRERERIFRRTWQFAASLEDLRSPGDFVAVNVVDVPIVITRDGNGTLRAFYNICRHRAGVVARGCGNRRTLQCQYHGWTYNLDGSLRHAPEFEGVQAFNRNDFGLVPIRVETWGPFAFVNMDHAAMPLAEMLGAITSDTARFDFNAMHRVERREYPLAANWKLYIDNYLEGYHVPVGHPGLHRELDYDNYRVETFRYYSKQHAPFREARANEPQARRYNEVDGDDRAHYYWIFPNFMLNIYMGMVQINVIVPLSHDRTVTIFEWYLPRDASSQAIDRMYGSIPFSEEIQEEDIQLCEDVWRNLQCGVYDRGRFSVKRENGVHHFHGLYAEFMEL